MQKAASATAEQAAAAGQAAAERAAASTLFNVAMPPLPLQQGCARLLLHEDMAMEEQDASLSASRPTGGSIWPCAAALCRWLGDNADVVRRHSCAAPHPRPRPGCTAGCMHDRCAGRACSSSAPAQARRGVVARASTTMHYYHPRPPSPRLPLGSARREAEGGGEVG